MCIRDSLPGETGTRSRDAAAGNGWARVAAEPDASGALVYAVSYTHLRAHETVLDLVCRLLLEKKKHKNQERQKIKERTEQHKKHAIQVVTE